MKTEVKRKVKKFEVIPVSPAEKKRRRKRDRRALVITGPYLLWMLIFTLVPMIFVVYYAFTDPSGAFTIDNVKSLLGLESGTQNVI